MDEIVIDIGPGNRVDQKDIAWGDINWMSSCVFDHAKKGNLGRTFWPAKKGSNLRYVPNDLVPGDTIEVASDILSGDDREYNRRYFSVCTISPTELTVVECEKPGGDQLRDHKRAVALKEAEASAHPGGYAAMNDEELQRALGEVQNEIERRARQPEPVASGGDQGDLPF